MLSSSSRLRGDAVAAVSALFLLVGYLGITHHEIWLDEAHHWLLARDSRSIGEMIFNARYEGHPILWNAILFLLSRLTPDPLAMQNANLAIATAAVALFLRRAPLRPLVKVPLVFGYFVSYEYGVISRNYALVFLCTCAALCLFELRHRRYLLFCASLALLASTHMFALILAAGLWGYTAWEVFTARSSIERPRFLLGAGFLALVFGLTIVLFRSPTDHIVYQSDVDPLLSFKRFGKAFSFVWKGLVPLPDVTADRPWNTNVVNIHGHKVVAALFYALGWLIPAALLARRPRAMAFFYLVAGALALILFVSPILVSSRHQGFAFILLLAALWIAHAESDAESGFRLPLGRRAEMVPAVATRAAPFLWVAVLAAQIAAAAFFHVIDWHRPFSNGKAVAQWLGTHAAPDETIAVSGHFAGPPVSAYLGRKLYYPENQALGSFCHWNTRPYTIAPEQSLERVGRLLRDSGMPRLLLVSNVEIPSSVLQDEQRRHGTAAALTGIHQGALVSAEDYWIYVLSR